MKKEVRLKMTVSQSINYALNRIAAETGCSKGEVLTKALPDDGDRAEAFLSFFNIIEVNEEIGRRAAILRSDRRRLKAMDAVILASAQLTGRILITRNSQDFPAEMPGIRIPYTL